LKTLLSEKHLQEVRPVLRNGGFFLVLVFLLELHFGTRVFLFHFLKKLEKTLHGGHLDFRAVQKHF